MLLKLYKNTSDRKSVTKNIENVQNLTINQQFDKPELTMTITLPKNQVYLINEMTNYAYIEDFDRYYFVEIVKKPAGLVDVILKEDVLSSHFDKIKNLSAIISRQESAYNLYLPDGNIPMQTKKNVVTKRFVKSLADTTGAMILITQGGEYFIKENEGGTENGQ